MADLNNFSCTGRLTKDVELRSTSTGKSVAEFSVAVGKRFKPQDGEPDAIFVRCKLWGNSADFAAEYGTKGRRVAVSGRLDTRRYVDQSGANREIWELVCETLDFMDYVQDDSGGSGQRAQPQGRQAQTRQPAQQQRRPAQPAASRGGYRGSSNDEYDPFADE